MYDYKDKAGPMKSSISDKGLSSAAKKRNLSAMSRMTTIPPKYHKLIFGHPISSLKDSSAIAK